MVATIVNVMLLLGMSLWGPFSHKSKRHIGKYHDQTKTKIDEKINYSTQIATRAQRKVKQIMSTL